MNSRLHRWWLWGCFAALLLASWAGGFGVAVTAVFIGIYLTGLVLIGPDEPEAETVEAIEADETVVGTDETDPTVGADATIETVEVLGEDPAEPYPDDEETETTDTATATASDSDTDSDTDTDTDSDSDESLESSDSSRS